MREVVYAVFCDKALQGPSQAGYHPMGIHKSHIPTDGRETFLMIWLAGTTGKEKYAIVVRMCSGEIAARKRIKEGIIVFPSARTAQIIIPLVMLPGYLHNDAFFDLVVYCDTQKLLTFRFDAADTAGYWIKQETEHFCAIGDWEETAQFGNYKAINQHVLVGANASSGGKLLLGGTAPIVIGHHTMIGFGVILHTSTYDESDWQRSVERPIQIGRHCWLGAGARIMPGVRIRDYAVVGAGSCVCASVPERAIVCGNPARIVKFRDNHVFGRTVQGEGFWEGMLPISV